MHFFFFYKRLFFTTDELYFIVKLNQNIYLNEETSIYISEDSMYSEILNCKVKRLTFTGTLRNIPPKRRFSRLWSTSISLEILCIEKCQVIYESKQKFRSNCIYFILYSRAIRSLLPACAHGAQYLLTFLACIIYF